MTLILGGVRSGKSTYAQKLLEDSADTVIFIATATAGDDEMAARIRAHQANRPAHWSTIEAPMNVGSVIKRLPPSCNILLDCITLLASNVLMSCPEPVNQSFFEKSLQREIEEIIKAFDASSGKWVIVSNEVGLGVIPYTTMGRYYRDALGNANQKLAAAADHVIFMIAGLPMKIK